MRTTVAAGLILLAGTAAAEPTLTARSVGFTTACAEMDNVLVELSGEAVRGFEVRATHPAYLAPGLTDIMAADFTNCQFEPEPIFEFTPESFVLYEDERVILRGHRQSRSWRSEEVDVVVGERRFPTLNLTQLFAKLDGEAVEVLVLYPNDGHWRPKPLPPIDRVETGYGSSLLIGPIEFDRRRLVKLREVRFDPATLTYHLDFVQGGSAAVRVASIDRTALELDVRFDPPLSGPIALFSSMYVAEDNADVAWLAHRAAGDPMFERLAIPDVGTVTGTAFRFGRDVPSRHNTSAPDVALERFVVAD